MTIEIDLYSFEPEPRVYCVSYGYSAYLCLYRQTLLIIGDSAAFIRKPFDTVASILKTRNLLWYQGSDTDILTNLKMSKKFVGIASPFCLSLWPSLVQIYTTKFLIMANKAWPIWEYNGVAVSPIIKKELLQRKLLGEE